MYRAKSYKNFRSVGPAFMFAKYRKPLIYGGIGLGVLYMSNLEQVAMSHRWRFMIVPRWLELTIGSMSYKQIMAQYRGDILPDNSTIVQNIKRIMADLIKVSGLDNSDIDWQIHVIGGDYPPNAFVLPGGKVFVFTSILPICKTNEGIATVLSHELAHQVCRHTAENMSHSPLYILAAALAYGITGSSGIENILLKTLVQLPASRKMETEADYVGMLMMAKACFNPASAVGVWQRMVQMERSQGVSTPEFLSTHPASERRIEDIKQHLPEAEHVRAENCQYGHDMDTFWRS